MLNIAALGLRGFLAISSAVVLGLSVTLAKHQGVDMPPVETSFGSFTGAFGLLAAGVGIVALFIDSLPSLIPLVIDALAGVFFIAGGVALAIAMKGISCTDGSNQANLDRFQNKILNGGCRTTEDCAVLDGKTSSQEVLDALKGRCIQAQADFAFQFIAFVTALGALAMTFLIMRRSGSKVYA